MLQKFKMKFLMALSLLGLALVSRAEGETQTVPTVSELWGDLGINFGTQIRNVFTALASPVGTVVAVVFVMAVFWFCLRMARNAINKRQGV